MFVKKGKKKFGKKNPLDKFLESVEDYDKKEDLSEANKQRGEEIDREELLSISEQYKKYGVDELIKLSLQKGMKAYKDAEDETIIISMRMENEKPHIGWTIYEEKGKYPFWNWYTKYESGNDSLSKKVVNSMMQIINKL